MQVFDGVKYPISFVSKKLLKNERSYSVIEREILGEFSNSRLTCMGESLC